MTASSPNIAQQLNLQNGLQAFTSGISLTQLNITHTSVAANTSVEHSVVMPGLQTGDWVEITPPGLTSGVTIANARCSAPNTLQMQIVNSTAGALTPPSGIHAILVVR